MNLPRQVMLDITKEDLKSVLDRAKTERGLNDLDFENILYQLLCEVKDRKEYIYSCQMVNLMAELQKKQADYVVKEE